MSPEVQAGIKSEIHAEIQTAQLEPKFESILNRQFSQDLNENFSSCDKGCYGCVGCYGCYGCFRNEVSEATRTGSLMI